MPKTETLKDGTSHYQRTVQPRTSIALMNSSRGLSAEDRKYLRIDVTNRKTVEQRLKLMEFGYHLRLVAFHGDEIVGEAALELPFEEWRRHQGEIRVIVGRPSTAPAAWA